MFASKKRILYFDFLTELFAENFSFQSNRSHAYFSLFPHCIFIRKTYIKKQTVLKKTLAFSNQRVFLSRFSVIL